MCGRQLNVLCEHVLTSHCLLSQHIYKTERENEKMYVKNEDERLACLRHLFLLPPILQWLWRQFVRCALPYWSVLFLVVLVCCCRQMRRGMWCLVCVWWKVYESWLRKNHNRRRNKTLSTCTFHFYVSELTCLHPWKSELLLVRVASFQDILLVILSSHFFFYQCVTLHRHVEVWDCRCLPEVCWQLAASHLGRQS